MKFVHTGDWHLGKTMRGKQRGDEHAAVLQELLDFIDRERVDLVLLAGDVFETPTPSAESEKLFFDFAVDVRRHGANLAVITGNHDGQKRFEAFSKMMLEIGVAVQDSVQPLLNENVIEFYSRDGAEVARVVAVPFPHESQVNRWLESSDANHGLLYRDRVGKHLESLGDYFDDPTRINILLGHLMMEFGDFGGGEKSIHLSKGYQVPQASVPASAQYVALGHLHRQQFLRNTPAMTCYAGSILQLDFGEIADRKGFMMVEIAPGEQARAEFVKFNSGRLLRDLRGSEAELRVYAEDPEVQRDWLRVKASVNSQLGETSVGLLERLQKMFPEAVQRTVEIDGLEIASTAVGAEQLQLKSPEELYRAFLHQHYGTVSEASVKTFLQLYQEVSNTEMRG